MSKYVIFGAVSVLVIGFLISIVAWLMGMYSTTVSMERQLNSQYLSNQNYLSAYVSGFYEQSGVLVTQSDQLDRILTDAVKGRYDGAGGFSADGALFSAVVESYPEASPTVLLQNWSKLQDYITSQREGYKNVQDKLLDMLRGYDTYRTAEPVRAIALNIMGFPSKNLEARLSETVTTGEVARNQMYLIVLTGDTKKAYESGEMAPLKVPTPVD